MKRLRSDRNLRVVRSRFDTEPTEEQIEAVLESFDADPLQHDTQYTVEKETAKPPRSVLERREGEGSCSLCMEPAQHALVTCGHHVVCDACLDSFLDNISKCPLCNARFAPEPGCCPDGTVTVKRLPTALPGFSNNSAVTKKGGGTWSLYFDMPSGTQTDRVGGNVGQKFAGKSETAFFPDTKVGRDRARRVLRAFRGGILFRVGMSVTLGVDNRTTFNGVHLKTAPDHRSGSYCYPDDSYLDRVDQELKSKGF